MRRHGQIRHLYGFRGALVEQVDEPIGAVPSFEQATRTLLLLSFAARRAPSIGILTMRELQ
jgi:hypothetical protein